jgi:hypothetical protein
MTFRLSPELRGRLIAAAGERPIGDEIRRRLERSFEESYEAVLRDRRSRAFLDGIVTAMRTLERDGLVSAVNNLAMVSTSSTKGAAPLKPTRGAGELAPWHSDPNAFAGLRVAVLALLSIYRPAGKPDEIALDTLGRLVAGAAMAGLEQNDPERLHDLRSTDQDEGDDKAGT